MERLARLTIIQLRAAILRKAGFFHQLIDLVNGSAIENRGSILHAHFLACPTQHGLVNLTQVHTGRHTQRVQHHVNRTTVLKERKILLAHDLGHTTLVTVTTGHLVTNTQFALVGNVNLRHLNNACRQFRTDSGIKHLTCLLRIEFSDLDKVIADNLGNQTVDLSIVGPFGNGNGCEINCVQHLLGELGTLGNHDILGIVMNVMGNLAFQNLVQLGYCHIMQVVELRLVFLLNFSYDILIFGFGFSVFDTSGQILRTDNHTLHGWRRFQRGVFHIAGLVAENGAEKLLLRTGIRFTFRGDLTNQDVTFVHLGAHADKTILHQIAGGLRGNIRNVVGEFLDTALGIANIHGERLNMYRSVQIVRYGLLGNHDSILEVVALPRHECHHQVAAKGQLSVLGSITFRQHIALLHFLTFRHNRAHVDAGVLVGSSELQQLIVLGCRIEAHQLFRFGAFILNFNMLRVN